MTKNINKKFYLVSALAFWITSYFKLRYDDVLWDTGMHKKLVWPSRSFYIKQAAFFLRIWDSKGSGYLARAFRL
jgi:hypothetical protein